ncbi:gamma-glutamyltransferase family protein [Aurantiacibacter marinus]|uniref:Gamma-glutamyltranspeptidase n=1 Tax=Aurantiacibacter marinus TaxID=874156 RepID=A0A0H0XWL9_9SPHN|nr:gamma-glutamyltransferase family protein [Aurantiacibacter marinus]KLI64715.1 gamma-glutamyltranspeptidase [Aurantiacibacter marinus]
MIRTRMLFAASAALALGACQTVPSFDQPATNAPAASQPGVVSAADPRAAEAGAEILRQGGSATDAAIAVMLALTVVEPQSSGIGGGGFFVRTNTAGDLITIDGRETAPAEAGPDWFLGPDGEPLGYRDAVISGRSVGVPGNIALAASAHEQYGKLEWAALFQPAIRLARDGWALSERGAYYVERVRERAVHQPEGEALFLDAEGNVLPVGTMLTNADLAATLEALATDGPAHMYADRAGELAAHVAAQTPGDAAMRTSDITEYSAVSRPAVCGDYREYTICSMGPPSSGATTVLAILGQLERFDIAAMGPESHTAWHLFAESQRLAYADREAYLADPDYVSVPAGITDPAYLAARSLLMAPGTRMTAVEAGTPPGIALAPPDGDEPVENGTSHFAVTDSAGNMVSWTSTIEGPFGSGLMFGGYYLNNELTDFSFRPDIDGAVVANRVEGGKRPRSSMSPTIVFDENGTAVLAIGAAGGGTIPVQVAKALVGYIDWDLTAQDAISLPMLYSPGDTIAIEEDNVVPGLQAALEALGHSVAARELPLKANAVEWRGGRWIGAADPRSEGVAVTQ